MGGQEGGGRGVVREGGGEGRGDEGKGGRGRKGWGVSGARRGSGGGRRIGQD